MGERGSRRLSESASLGLCSLETLWAGFRFCFICMSQTNGGRQEGKLSLGPTASSSVSPQRWAEAEKDCPWGAGSGKDDVTGTGRLDLGDRGRPCCSRDWMESSRGGDRPAQRDSCKAPAQGKSKPDLGKQMEGRQHSQGLAGH